MNNIGENIKKYRIQAGFTQEEVARKIGKSKNVVSNWENGLNKPDADIIGELCTMFQIHPNDIFSWEVQGKTREQILVEKYSNTDDGMKRAVDKLLDMPE